MSWLGFLNFFLLQWFCVRLGRVVRVLDGKTVGWRLTRYVVPLTGWWSDFIYIWRRA